MPNSLISNETIWSVSALNFEIKTMLEKGIGSIWIEGEISNFARPASGHWYFSLKDDRAQLRAAMFKNRNGRVAFTPENGMQVLIRAQVTLYEARGEYQVIVEHMEEAGVGRLMHEFEALKKQLSAEGLFDQKHKKPIPAQAGHIGIITSASGAAIRDALSVIQRRSPSSQVTVYATAVQGEAATAEIVHAIEAANKHNQCNVLLLIRGGGSLEDLWCFNEESVARCVFNSRIPVVSGVGHEVDFTICDFIADARAPTPSVAAEMVTMDQYEVMLNIDRLQQRLVALQVGKNAVLDDAVGNLNKRLIAFHPERQMQGLKQRLNHARIQLMSHQNQLQTLRHNHLLRLSEKLRLCNPLPRIQTSNLHIQTQQHFLQASMRNRLQDKKHALSLNSLLLDNLSPLKTLSRGYATISKNQQVITSIDQLCINQDIRIQMKDGVADAKVLHTTKQRED